MPPYTRAKKRALTEIECEEIEVTWTGRKRGKLSSVPEPIIDDDKEIKSLNDVANIFKENLLKDLQDLETSLKFKKNQISQLEEELFNKNAKILNLTNENTILKEQVLSLGELHTETSKENSKQFDYMQKVIDTTRQSNESLILENTDIKKKLQRTQQKKCKECLREREKYKEKIEDLKNEKGQLLDELAEKQAKQLITENRYKEELKSSTINYQEKINIISKDKDAQIINLQSDLQELKFKLLSQEVDTLNLKALEEKIQKIVGDKEVFEERTWIEKLETFKKTKDELELAHRECDDEKERSDKIISELKQMNSEIGENLKRSKIMRKIAEEKLKFKEKEISDKIETLTNLSKDFNGLQGKCDELNKTLAKVNHELATETKSKNLLKSKLLERENEMTKQEQEHDGTLACKDEEIRKLLDKAVEKDELHATIKSELKGEIEKLKKDLIEKEKRTEEQIGKLKEFLQHSKQEYDQYKGMLEKKNGKLREVAQKVFATSKAELSKKEEEIQYLKDEMKMLKKYVDKKDSRDHQIVQEEKSQQGEHEEEEMNQGAEEIDNEETEDGNPEQNSSVPENPQINSFDENIMILTSFINEDNDHIKVANDISGKSKNGSVGLLEQIECVTNQFKLDRVKGRVMEICRKSRHLFSAKKYEMIEKKILHHYSQGQGQVLENDDTDILNRKITNLLIKLSTK